MNKFAEKKKLLAAESEAYRQLLKLEFHTLKLHVVRTKRHFSSASSYMPIIMSGLPLLSVLLGRKRGSSVKRMSALALVAWKAFQRFAPLFKRRKRSSDDDENAAEEYLSKRL
ncbi:MAG TPA: hypothetical protein VN761_01200 [Candidatus Polarisedimenticolia bacterium]|nr:hypothetical protein [Candidatus Polarisedimenticolia bacterium]